jgi:hypothetical protein
MKFWFTVKNIPPTQKHRQREVRVVWSSGLHSRRSMKKRGFFAVPPKEHLRNI